MGNEYNIEVVSGDSYELNMIYRDEDKVPINLTDYEVYFQVRKSKVSDEIEFDSSFIISAEDGVEGTIKFTLTADETEVLNVCFPSTKYVYAMRLTSPDTLDVKTLISGTLEVMKGVI